MVLELDSKKKDLIKKIAQKYELKLLLLFC